MKFCAMIFSLLLVALSVDAGVPVSLDQMRTVYRAAQGGAMEPGKAIGFFDEVLDDHPNDALALVYKGSLKTIQARESTVPWRKLSLINEGFALMAQALARIDQADGQLSRDRRVEILMVSGLTNAAVPKSFGRRSMAERDLKRLLESGEAETLGRDFKAALYAWLAVIAAERSNQEAQKYLVIARTIDAAIAERIWGKR